MKPILAILIAACAASFGQESKADASRPQYLAYRTPKPVTSGQWQALVKEASTIGLKPIEMSALQRQGILVFEKPKDKMLDRRVGEAFLNLIHLPVRNYNGVLSVSSGYFYLQFQDQVPLSEMRKRLSDAGFTVVTPDPAPGMVIVVQGSRIPGDRERELAKLKTLPELLYAAPDDIPLPSHKSPKR